ncbi:hypothetical protein NM208_g2653 [Fusarium decemcellulare]|uniref:Uncharacterized protein n=1 Tax=Fusarium decemcellulare TaxID=57161 RepID=A0ACC1SRQ1_9HYPO|nr:hypothetical protein NM208_g2653 [Fusarium decemcellulare]
MTAPRSSRHGAVGRTPPRPPQEQTSQFGSAWCSLSRVYLGINNPCWSLRYSPTLQDLDPEPKEEPLTIGYRVHRAEHRRLSRAILGCDKRHVLTSPLPVGAPATPNLSRAVAVTVTVFSHLSYLIAICRCLHTLSVATLLSSLRLCELETLRTGTTAKILQDPRETETRPAGAKGKSSAKKPRASIMAPARNPANWDEYEGRPSPTGSVTSSVLAHEQALIDDDDDDDTSEQGHGGGFMARRRSSVTNRLAAMRFFAIALEVAQATGKTR